MHSHPKINKKLKSQTKTIKISVKKIQTNNEKPKKKKIILYQLQENKKFDQWE